MIAKIIVDSRSKHVDRVFDYLIPDFLENEISIGSRVLVPFSSGNREVEGFCVGFCEKSESRQIKSIIKLANDIPAFDEEMLPVIKWMKKKYLSSYLDIIHTIVPSGTSVKSEEWIILLREEETRSEIRKNIISIIRDNGGGIEYNVLEERCGRNVQNQIRAMVKDGILRKEYRQSAKVRDKKIKFVRLSVTADEAEKAAMSLRPKAPVQSRMLQLLADNGEMPAIWLRKVTNGTISALTALIKKGFLEVFEVEAERNPYRGRVFEKTEKMTPTSEQEKAINKITSSVKNGDGSTYLLHGVTGSGKTEVFMQAIEYAVSIGKSAIMLVPEISLTPQMVSRFMSRFGDCIAIFHSALSQGERYDQWKRIKSGGADIVIGARSAVFAPLKNIGIIIMDEEHSDTYKSEMSPRYHARETAIFRAKQSGAAVVLASATPSVESYYKAQEGEYTLLEMNTRFNNNKMPYIYIEDMRSELARGNKSMLSARLYKEIEKNLQKGEQTILFLNRRGFSTFVSCRTCGYVPECPNCSISLTYHKFGNNLKCHYCGYIRPTYTKCPECDSKYIRYFGGGTQKVEEEINRLFPNASSIRMDMDTTGKKQSHEKILQRFEKDKIDILIGTQMVAKGLDFENVTLVGVITADTMLHLHDFRSGERTFAMLEQVSGRAGRGEKEGRAVIQTYTPEHEAVKLVKTHEYKEFYRNEIAQRHLLWYPPFCKMVGVQFQGSSEETTAKSAGCFVKALGNIKEMGQKIQVLGPIPSYVSKIKNKYRWQIIFKCEDDDKLGEKLSEAEMMCRANKELAGVSIIIDKSPGMIY
ncbi:MAG: primosomal protein N' [Oscillospiraceae bacterium]|nr:primosomal protein N' [Oscillospiraceae bacterium]